MRLNINLATKPYQDVRRFLLRWGGVVLLLAVCTMALVWTAVSTWRQVARRECKDFRGEIGDRRPGPTA